MGELEITRSGDTITLRPMRPSGLSLAEVAEVAEVAKAEADFLPSTRRWLMSL